MDHPIWMTTNERVAHEHKAAVALKGAMDVLVSRGYSPREAVAKLQRVHLSYDELERLAKSGKRPKVHLAQPEPDDREPDDDPDDKLDKLAVAVQRAHPEAGFSKQQAAAWCFDNLPEARELLQISKRRSIGRYGEQAAGHFDKAESSVSQSLPENVAKLSDTDLTSLFRAGQFDKMGGHKPPGPSRANDGGRDGTHRDENTRQPRAMLGDHLTEVDSANSLVTFPIDEMNTKEATEKAVKEYMARGMNYSEAVSAHHQRVKEARGW